MSGGQSICPPLLRTDISLTNGVQWYILYVYTGESQRKVECRVGLSTIVSKWGNSQGIRVPVEVLKKAQIGINDELYLDVDEKGRIILTKVPLPKEGTIEYLFKDYDGDSFQTEVIDLGEPVGNEAW